MPAAPAVEFDLEPADNARLANLCGPLDEHLRHIEQRLGVEIHNRGGHFRVLGPPEGARETRRLLKRLYSDAGRAPLTREEVHLALTEAATKLVLEPAAESGATDEIVIKTRRGIVRGRGAHQQQYLRQIRESDLTFGIGPAGTGKTYLAVASAVHALERDDVRRLVLVRPAVEAGERLGFLPGDLAEKIDPYLRPLFDALYEMLGFEQVARLIERNVIEVAPLAFMRGRAQPLTSRVLTPIGWKQIGELKTGDAVIGSDGRPTEVTGVYPQGRKEVFRLITSDRASTRCCAEHLWFVRTPDDRKHGKSGRVIETRAMAGWLRRHHNHRFELPLVSAPVDFPERPVPLEPYTLGLLLGDGCITTKTTPSFTSADAELVVAAAGGLGAAIQLVPKSPIDYVLRHVHGGRGGRRISNPVTVALRQLGLAGTNSATKFVPEDYLCNAAEVRLAVLQGLLDTDGGPVTQEGRTCRIQFTTASLRLRDDVVFLVRSLGGVAYSRTRFAAGRKPGRAHGRDVHHRSDAYILDIRLPEGIVTFRLRRKAEKYSAHGAGRPMRFVEVIEPDGIEDTVCIRVAAADALYVTDDFILTHNTLNESFVILDEAQNTTVEQMKMFLTRIGFGSTAVVTGDLTQSDLPRSERSGLKHCVEVLKDVPGISLAWFDKGDVVRHPLVQRIVQAYEEFEAREGGTPRT